MAQLDADAVGGAVHRIEQTRAEGMRTLSRRLAEQGLLRPGVTPEEAADVLWLLTSFESFDLMYSGRRMPVDAIVTTLVTTAERTLYDRPDREAISPV
jgi:hypothetical protein